MSYLSPAIPETMFMCEFDAVSDLSPKSRGTQPVYSNGPAQPDTPTGCSGRGHQDHPHVCTVHGCDAVLEKAYDKKCRTCHDHRQSPIVEFNAMPHRFCQKCSRFHLLSEFDGTKRNCRQRLNEHNFRQRRLRMLKKAARESTPSTPSYSPACENSAYCAYNVKMEPSSPPALCPAFSIDLDFDGAQMNPLVLDEFDIDVILNSGMFDLEGSIPVAAAVVSMATPMATAAAPQMQAPLPSPPMAVETSSRMFQQPQCSESAFVPFAPVMAPNPLELDEFLWLEQSMAAPWNSAFNCNYLSGIPMLPQ